MMDIRMSPLFFFLIASLAVWRVTHLLNAEDGPFDALVRLRTILGESFPGKLMDCFYCLSVWIAAPFAVFISNTVWEWVLMWLALSASAIFLERIHGVLEDRDGGKSQMPYYLEDPLPAETESQEGENNGVLRK